MEKFGFVGLPNAGKSSLYNALTGGSALAAPYAFATTDPNIGVAKVSDERLDKLADMSSSKKVVAASVQFNDIGGLVEGASQGEGLGNKFLAGIREVDAIVFVLRAFKDDDVPGPQDPIEHLRVVETELTLADLEMVSTKFNKLERASKGDNSLKAELETARFVLSELEEGNPLYRVELDEDQKEIVDSWYLLTNKPVLAIVNIDEDQLGDSAEIVAPVIEDLPDSASVFGVCVQLEAEAAQLDASDRAEMLGELGLGDGVLPKFLAEAYKSLGLRTFFTTGEKETRAWTFRDGSPAPVCAGRIHTDMQRGFIRAETIHWDELLEANSWGAARESGKIRAEGKDYLVKDGDVLEFRFNV